MSTWPGSTGPEPAGRARIGRCGGHSGAAPPGGEFSLCFSLKCPGPLCSIRLLEIGALQEAIVDENL